MTMLKRKRFYSLFLTVTVLFTTTLIPITAQAVEDDPMFSIVPVTDESNEKLFRLSPYYTEAGNINVAIEPVHADIEDRGELSLSVSPSNEKTMIYDGTLPKELYDSAIADIQLNTEYTVILKQTVGVIEYLYYGTFTVIEADGVMRCESFLYEDKQRTMESIRDSVEKFAAKGQTELTNAEKAFVSSNVVIEKIDESELPWNEQRDVTRNELESNDNYDDANAMLSGDTTYGKLWGVGDVDWYSITPLDFGDINFWLGDVPNGTDYDIQIFASNGTTLKGGGYQTGTQSYFKLLEDYNDSETYYVKVYSASGYSQSLYRMCIRVLPIDKQTPIRNGRFGPNINTLSYYREEAIQYKDEINDAFYRWRVPKAGTTPINNIVRYEGGIEGKLQSQIQFKSKALASGYEAGFTALYNTIDDAVQYPNNNLPFDTATYWRAAIISLYPQNIKDTPYGNAEAVASHEIGHVLGLDHSDNRYSIMYQNADRLVSSPALVDLHPISLRYW